MMLMIMMMIMDVGTCLSFIERLPFTRVGVVDLQLLCYAGCYTLHSQDPKAKEAPTLSKTYSSAPTTPKSASQDPAVIKQSRSGNATLAKTAFASFQANQLAANHLSCPPVEVRIGDPHDHEGLALDGVPVQLKLRPTNSAAKF